MEQNDKEVEETGLMRESLANLQHEIWSHWMRYLFSKGVTGHDGVFMLSCQCVELWQRQMNTPYAELSDKEKDSDREQADKIIDCLWGTK